MEGTTSLACPKCGDLETCFFVDLTQYPLHIDDEFQVTFDLSQPDDVPDWVRDLFVPDPNVGLVFCRTCHQRFQFGDVRVLKIDHQGNVTEITAHSQVVQQVVERLREAGITAYHEYRDHITFSHGGYFFHWGTINETWGGDVSTAPDVEDYTEDALVSTVASASTNATAIFAAIYLATMQFLEGR